MNIDKLKKLNQDAIIADGNYNIVNILHLLEQDIDGRYKVAKTLRDNEISKLEQHILLFDVDYLDVRNIALEQMSSKQMNLADFVTKVGHLKGEDYYVAGLYDAKKAKDEGISPLQLAKDGYGIVISVMKFDEKEFRDVSMEVVFNSKMNLLKPIATLEEESLCLKSYLNYAKEKDWGMEVGLWALVEKNLTKEQKKEQTKELPKEQKEAKHIKEFNIVRVVKEEEKEVKQEKEEKKYVSTLYAIKPPYIRPYNEIGYNNEARQGKER